MPGLLSRDCALACRAKLDGSAGSGPPARRAAAAWASWCADKVAARRVAAGTGSGLVAVLETVQSGAAYATAPELASAASACGMVAPVMCTTYALARSRPPGWARSVRVAGLGN